MRNINGLSSLVLGLMIGSVVGFLGFVLSRVLQVYGKVDFAPATAVGVMATGILLFLVLLAMNWI